VADGEVGTTSRLVLSVKDAAAVIQASIA